MISLCVYFFLFPDGSDVEYLFIYMLGITISPFGNCLKCPLPIFQPNFFLLLLSFKLLIHLGY